MAAIDWEKLRTEYTTTNTSYRKLAEKYGVSFNTLKDHAVGEHWADEKKKVSNAIVKTAQQKVVRSRSDACAAQLKRVAMAADTATLVVEKMMQDAEQFRRHIVIVKEGHGYGPGEYRETQDIDERVLEKYDTAALKNFTGALKDLVTVIRNVYGLPTIIEKAAMDLALDRLQLERDKAHIVDAANVIEVEFTDDETEGYAG